VLKVSDFIAKLEEIAPPWLAEEGDRIGLQVGDPNANARVLRVCVDACPRVIDSALGQGADLIVSHHPLIYTPLLSVTADDPVAQTVAALVRKGASLYVMHTNYDSAPDGVNDCLAAALGLADTVLMTPRKRDQFHKIAVFVPEGAVGPVRDAMAQAGAGVISSYTYCSFYTPGTGTFLPGDQTQPHKGTPGAMEEVEEYRLEMLCSGACLGAVIVAMRAAHPYEEVAYDVYPLANEPSAFGFGRVGDLDTPMPLSEYAEIVREALRLSCLKIVGQPDRIIKRVAVGAGGCSSLYADAARLGADLYVTGDTKHHDMLAAEALGMAMIDAGHFETERPGMVALVDRIIQALPGHEIDVAYVE
jgi:dinuclear metal center YbgI/SA1388 family protein